MPYKPKKPCRQPGCNKLTHSSYCEEHTPAVDQYERTRSRCKMYSTARWIALRALQLSKNPLCCECKKKGINSLATEVDHITPHKGDPSLFYDESNLQSLCKRCHSRKTAKEDGRWKVKEYIF